jgi:3-deoxy-manno-octulosonate cytidylyltransferase (CMP-KDO synthetase)
MADVLILIPARLAATRLPGKPLALIDGEPMIVHVLRRAQAAAIGPVVVATDSADVAAAVDKAGGSAVLTGPDHASGSDRIFEALGKLDSGRRAEIVVNVQGDLPTIAPAAIRAALTPLADAAVDIATLAAEIKVAAERVNPHVVKVVGTPVAPDRLRALYFTRATAPAGEGPLYHHIGLYAFRQTAAVALGAPRKARAIAGAGSRHAHRRPDRRYRAARGRYAGGFGKGARHANGRFGTEMSVIRRT